jgi:hypothetical protein
MYRVRFMLTLALAVSGLGISAVGAQAKVPSKTHLVRITGGTTTLTPTAATVSFLTSHGVTVTAVAPATLSGTAVSLPVIGGVARPKNLNGILLHRGAVKFATAKRSVTLRHITLWKLGKRAHLSARAAGRTLLLGNITGLAASVTGKTATVTGEVHLSAAAAHVINRVAGKHLVSAGADLGSVSSSLTLA